MTALLITTVYYLGSLSAASLYQSFTLRFTAYLYIPVFWSSLHAFQLQAWLNDFLSNPSSTSRILSAVHLAPDPSICVRDNVILRQYLTL